MKIKFKFVKIYFYIILTISICIAFFGNNIIDAYGQVLFMLTTFPVFGILYQMSFNQFSDGIEYKRPDLFDKYKMTFGIVRRINGFEIFNNSDFNNLEDKELIESLKLTKQLLGLTIKSFVAIIILGISFMLIKR
jgi:hypothetical protein